MLIGNSGVGKSSIAKAGVLAALKRQAWPDGDGTDWPTVFKDSRQWCFLSLKPGTEPVKALVEAFIDTWHYAAADPERVRLQRGWIDLLREGKSTLSDLIEATERRRRELEQPKPSAFFLYVDQGEELYVRAEEGQRRRFSELLAQALAEPRLRTMISLRADFFGSFQADKPLFKARHQIDVPPLGEEELREVVSRPAELLGARFEVPELVEIIARCTVDDSVKDVGALPLLSYTLDDMWKSMIGRGDGLLRLPAQSFDLSGVLVDRANSFLACNPNSEDKLRRIFTLKLATVRDDGEPTRRRALRSEFSDEEWRLIGELADHPNRLLVTARLETGETYAEVAHEAIFRRWDKLKDWIAKEREFLAWRSDLEAARRAWQKPPAKFEQEFSGWRSGLETARSAWASTPHSPKDDALLMGAALTKAQSWPAKRAEDLPAPDREFITRSIVRERKAQGRAQRIRALVYVLLVGMIVSLVGWIEQGFIKEQWKQWSWYWIGRPFTAANILPHVLAAEAERALKPGDHFRECDKDYCPEMVVLQTGSFMMGSPQSDHEPLPDEVPPHQVTIAKPFAVSRFALTFEEWETCVAYGDCDQVDDSGWGRGRQPVINVTWDDAQRYVRWLSRATGKAYRLLTEAEYEYATRAGKQSAYPWGDVIGKKNANCIRCGSQWDARRTAPVGSFEPNLFGLYDMVGNVWEWVEDCYHDSYDHAPQDGSAWITGGDCRSRVVRGGSWWTEPFSLRSASRGRNTTFNPRNGLGFRVGRTLSDGAGTITVPPPGVR